MVAAKLVRASELRLALIGQEPACTLLYSKLVTLQGMREPQTDKPLVLLLAGGPPKGGGSISRRRRWRKCV